MAHIAIMQGRLVPPEGAFIQRFPRQRWRDEFPRAAEAGLDAIEWIYDEYGESANPLATDEGVREMAELSLRHGVAVASLCADYFMDRSLVRTDGDERAARVDKLRWLLERCDAAGISRVVLPFVDQSRIAGREDEDCVIDVLSAVLDQAGTSGIELHLETDLAPPAFASVLARVTSRFVKVNYDSGNSAALGLSPAAEFAAYGDRIGSVHLKDRMLHGTTVPLGAGSADFDALFSSLDKVKYGGDFVLQVARSEPDQEVSWARANRQFLMHYLAGARPLGRQ